MLTKSLFPVFLICVACGPKAPDQGETEGEPTSTGETSSGSTSGGPTAGGPTSGGPTASVPTSGDPTPDTMTSGGETTTGGEATCPMGQPTLSPVWATVLEPDPKFEMGLMAHPVVLSDGTIAIAGWARTLDQTQMTAGVFWVRRDGQPLAWAPGSLQALNSIDVTGIEVAADDTVVLAGPAGDDFGNPLPFIARFAPGGPELTRAQLQTASLDRPVDLALHAEDTAVIVGRNNELKQTWLARVDIASGAPLWEVQLPNAATTVPGSLAVGSGGEIVAGTGQWPNEDFPEVKISRVDPDGTILWTRDLFEPGFHSGELADLLITPDQQAIVLRRWRVPTNKISATSLSLVDGSTLWDVDVTDETAGLPPLFTRAWLDADALLVPVSRGPEVDGLLDPLSVELHRVSLAGVPLDVSPLPLENREKGRERVTVARGVCGDLVLLQEDQLSWLGSFAP